MPALKKVPGKPSKSGKGVLPPVGAPSMRQDKSYMGKPYVPNKIAKYGFKGKGRK